MKTKLLPVALLLFLSGACGLILQVAWLREFRLVFGASTAASAAVLAMFMGGLGLGNALLGRRADRHRAPILLYAQLLLLIAVSAALSPFLLDLVRTIYVAAGGQMTLGMTGATVVRLALACLVLGLPTVSMGGTLPAAVKAVTPAEDRRRLGAGMLYGSNTLGAVVGAVLSTFFMLERFGTRTTLWLACLVGFLAALGAWALSGASARRRAATTAPAKRKNRRPAAKAAKTASKPPPAAPAAASPDAAVPPRLIYAAAGTVGFAFFLMELVWYRMLGPILGGTTYTFGLILALALLGIGLGGAAYPLVFRYLKPTLLTLGFTCALEAVCVAFPFALGDRLAIRAAVLREMSSGFWDTVLGWSVVGAIVILPAALASGIQFPLLVALAGRGDKDLGRHVGSLFAWNTVGAILGSLAGGFGLLPMLTAPGAWCAVVVLLSLLGLTVILASYKREGRRAVLLLPCGVLVLALVTCTATGPTAVWRHSAIGTGRTDLPRDRSANAMRDWMNRRRRAIVWEAEGVEASIAVGVSDSLSFIINGKADGNAIADAPTQIMLGILGAILHPEPQTGAVVGLGTGETAGWLAAVPSIERVDVIELEPAIDEMARRCAPVNHDALRHPKVHRIYNDAREVLLTSPRQYDLIVSEPSNPYRAGIAALYTREFYQAVRERLHPDGLFVQWLQQYEVDLQTVATILLTLRSAFPHVEVWEAEPGDMLLVCSGEPIRYDVPRLRRRIAEEPFQSALAITWRATDLEGFLARYVAGPGLVESLRRQGIGQLNTDDRNRIEYGFARSLGGTAGTSTHMLRTAAQEARTHRPLVQGGTVDWRLVESHRQLIDASGGFYGSAPANATAAQKTRAEVLQCLRNDDWRGAVARFEAEPYEPVWPTEVAILATAYAELGDAKALPLLERLAAFQPTEAEGIKALLLWRQGKSKEATEALENVFSGSRDDPWALAPAVFKALMTSVYLAREDPSQAERIYAAMGEPFALEVAEEDRRAAACDVASLLGPAFMAKSVGAFEPHVMWTERFLRDRRRAYEATGHPLTARAAEDLREYLRRAPDRSGSGP